MAKAIKDRDGLKPDTKATLAAEVGPAGRPAADQAMDGWLLGVLLRLLVERAGFRAGDPVPDLLLDDGGALAL